MLYHCERVRPKKKCFSIYLCNGGRILDNKNKDIKSNEKKSDNENVDKKIDEKKSDNEIDETILDNEKIKKDITNIIQKGKERYKTYRAFFAKTYNKHIIYMYITNCPVGQSINRNDGKRFFPERYLFLDWFTLCIFMQFSNYFDDTVGYIVNEKTTLGVIFNLCYMDYIWYNKCCFTCKQSNAFYCSGLNAY